MGERLNTAIGDEALDVRHPAVDGGPEERWSIDRLIDHIVDTHHAYVRAAMPVIASHLDEIGGPDRAHQPELALAAVSFGQLRSQLERHLMKEERLLFPYIRDLAERAGSCRLEPSPFGTIENPIRMMEREHLEAAETLARIRSLTRGCALPADGATACGVCMAELDEFEADLRRHVHLENDVLFPRAVELEHRAASWVGRRTAHRVAMMEGMERAFVYEERPQRVYWEITRACDLACRHCRAEAVPDPNPAELTTAQGRQLLERVAAFGDPLPHIVLTGGDPLKRQDLFALIAMARGLGLGVSVAPSATPLLTAESLRQLKVAGVEAISLSLDGSTAASHDAIRGIPGTYERTLGAARVAREVGLPFQVNTLVCAETLDELPAVYEHVIEMGAARWSLFFLVSVGRGQVLQPVSSERTEALLGWVATLSRPPRRGGVVVTTTEAPHLRRVALEQRKAAREAGALPGPTAGAPTHSAAGIRDGNGIVFVSHTGEICPSGFLELPAGNVLRDDLVEVYRTSALFRELRDPGAFGGRCGRCEYHWICGGSRSRAFSATGDPLAEDPLCQHEPPPAS